MTSVKRGRFDDELSNEERNMWISNLLQSEKSIGQYLAVECLRRRHPGKLRCMIFILGMKNRHEVHLVSMILDVRER